MSFALEEKKSAMKSLPGDHSENRWFTTVNFERCSIELYSCGSLSIMKTIKVGEIYVSVLFTNKGHLSISRSGIHFIKVIGKLDDIFFVEGNQSSVESLRKENLISWWEPVGYVPEEFKPEHRSFRVKFNFDPVPDVPEVLRKWFKEFPAINTVHKIAFLPLELEII